jgi:hypothetical protein
MTLIDTGFNLCNGIKLLQISIKNKAGRFVLVCMKKNLTFNLVSRNPDKTSNINEIITVIPGYEYSIN